MLKNTTGFDFSDDVGSPNSDVNATNLNDAIEYAIIRNIASGVVGIEHLDSEVAGAGLGGGKGYALSVKTDNSSLEVASDKVQIKAYGVKTSHIEDGAITKQKLSEDVQSTIDNVAKEHYEIGDYHFTEKVDSLTKKYGGEWTDIDENVLIASAGASNVASTTKSIELYSVVKSINAGDVWCRVYSDGWCEQGGILKDFSGNTEHEVMLSRKFKTPLFAGCNTDIAHHGEDSDVGYAGIKFSESKEKVIITPGRMNSHGYQPKLIYWQAKGYVELTNEEKENVPTFKVRYINMRRKISDVEA